MGYQKSVFHTKFENKRLTLVKNAVKKVLPQNTNFLGLLNWCGFCL
jgi:hypothetical protein